MYKLDISDDRKKYVSELLGIEEDQAERLYRFYENSPDMQRLYEHANFNLLKDEELEILYEDFKEV